MRLLDITLDLLFLTTATHASSDDAWSKFTVEVTEACTASSGFEQARVSDLIMFDDSLNKVATLVSGIHPQPHMDKAKGTVLCIYDKATHKTWIDEASGWSAPVPPLIH